MFCQNVTDGITTFSMTKFRIKDRIRTHWITTSIIECHYTECHNLLKVMLIVVMLSVAAKKKLL